MVNDYERRPNATGGLGRSAFVYDYYYDFYIIISILLIRWVLIFGKIHSIYLKSR